MLGRLTKFELSYQTRQVGFWISFAAMFLLGLFVMSTPSFSAAEVGERIKANGSLTVANIIGDLSLGIIFFATVFTVTGAMRDDVHKSLGNHPLHQGGNKRHDLVPSHRDCFNRFPVPGWRHCWGPLPGNSCLGPIRNPIGPINLIYFIYPLILYGLVNSFIIASVYILIASLTRNKTLVYVSAIGFFILLSLVEALGLIDQFKSLAAMLDPTGTQALANETRFWPPAEQNTRLIPLSGDILWNRHPMVRSRLRRALVRAKAVRARDRFP